MNDIFDVRPISRPSPAAQTRGAIQKTQAKNIFADEEHPESDDEDFSQDNAPLDRDYKETIAPKPIETPIIHGSTLQYLTIGLSIIVVILIVVVIFLVMRANDTKTDLEPVLMHRSDPRAGPPHAFHQTRHIVHDELGMQAQKPRQVSSARVVVLDTPKPVASTDTITKATMTTASGQEANTHEAKTHEAKTHEAKTQDTHVPALTHEAKSPETVPASTGADLAARAGLVDAADLQTQLENYLN